jgi:transposase-like protein
MKCSNCGSQLYVKFDETVDGVDYYFCHDCYPNLNASTAPSIGMVHLITVIFIMLLVAFFIGVK